MPVRENASGSVLTYIFRRFSNKMLADQMDIFRPNSSSNDIFFKAKEFSLHFQTHSSLMKKGRFDTQVLNRQLCDYLRHFSCKLQISFQKGLSDTSFTADYEIARRVFKKVYKNLGLSIISSRSDERFTYKITNLSLTKFFAGLLKKI